MRARRVLVAAFILAGSWVTSSALRAQGEAEFWSPAQASLWSPIQAAPVDWAIYGLRLNLPFGENGEMYGLDVGVAGSTTGRFGGIAVNAFLNYTGGLAQGIQVGGLVNRSSGGSVHALQVAGLANLAADADEALVLQIACLVNAAGPTSGMQIGTVNYASDMEGVQIGVVNVAGQLRGVQIGVVNVNSDGPVVFCPIVNACF